MNSPRNRVAARARRSDVALLVIDLQERLLPAILQGDRVVEQSRKMILAARLLGIPIVATEQYPRGIGATRADVREALGEGEVVEKLTFSCCGAETFRARWEAIGRRVALLCGIETHVCVLQTALDLLEGGGDVIVLADATGSRRAEDRDVALRRLRDAGATVATVESAIFELLERAGTPEFKEALKLVK